MRKKWGEIKRRLGKPSDCNTSLTRVEQTRKEGWWEYHRPQSSQRKVCQGLWRLARHVVIAIIIMNKRIHCISQFFLLDSKDFYCMKVEESGGKSCPPISSSRPFDNIKRYSSLLLIQFQSKWFLIFVGSQDPFRIWWKLCVLKQMHSFSEKCAQTQKICVFRNRLILGAWILLG